MSWVERQSSVTNCVLNIVQECKQCESPEIVFRKPYGMLMIIFFVLSLLCVTTMYMVAELRKVVRVEGTQKREEPEKSKDL
jgi:hypothetical protein